MKIGVIGVGYVGLVQGTIMAEFGADVLCMDLDVTKINALRQGILPIYEPGLKEMIDKNVSQGRLRFTTDMEETIKFSQVVFIAVGTPQKEDGSADLQYVFSVADEIGRYIESYTVIVDKSTVPVGTGKQVKERIQTQLRNRGVEIDFDVVSNPEFLREGKAVRDCLVPDRIVIGAQSERAISIMKKVYDVLYINKTPFLITNIETAEMIKYASNSFLAVKISFINEMALLADKVGADIQVIAQGMGLDGRISPKFLHAGVGYGGSCFPKDTKAIVDIASQYEESMLVINAAIDANEKQKKEITKRILSRVQKTREVKDMTFAIWGVSFKPETDDVREAPSIDVIRLLAKEGARFQIYCPQGMKEAKKLLEDLDTVITYCSNEYEATEQADALILMTEWNQFRGADLHKVKENMKGSYFFDLRNVFSKNSEVRNMFEYMAVGVDAIRL